MKVLVVGSGGREHALCWALAASPLIARLYCAPGNGGIAEDATLVPLAAEDLDGLTGFCQEEKIDFVVVGPEAPLVAGLVDRLEAEGIKAFGPTKAAARLEGSKGFMKELCRKKGIPSAEFTRVRDREEARRVIEARGAPIVVKADGLAAGKGVTVAASVEEALAAAEAALAGRFGEAGEELVIEECLEGEEVSCFALVDGRCALPLESAQDHKRVGEGEKGPYTGGMGAYSPAPIMTEALHDEVMGTIVGPLVEAMAEQGTPYKGLLYVGLMVTEEGPKLLEVNVRFGDPECQVLVKRLMSDLFPALLAARDGVLDQFHLRWHDAAALCVVMATKGYPGAYGKGSRIRNLSAAGEIDGVTIFHAGTKLEGGELLAHGGRVLGVTATGPTIAQAKASAYRAVDAIDWAQGFCRRDIGGRAVEG